MKKGWKITLRVLGALILILIVASVIIWTYLKSSFLDFEDDYIEQSSFTELNINGEVYLDRPGPRRSCACLPTYVSGTGAARE